MSKLITDNNTDNDIDQDGTWPPPIKRNFDYKTHKRKRSYIFSKSLGMVGALTMFIYGCWQMFAYKYPTDVDIDIPTILQSTILFGGIGAGLGFLIDALIKSYLSRSKNNKI